MTTARPHPPASTHTHTRRRLQEHFYLEPNACIVIPGEGDEYLAYASTQVGPPHRRRLHCKGVSV
jgi:xanthine dehydrogenase molybdopterin-binding subunit B